jgi:hypothetical protein
VNSWLAALRQRSVHARALRVALLVGSILALINHGDKLLAGTCAPPDWLRIGLTYCVPYLVSAYSSAQTLRHLSDRI